MKLGGQPDRNTLGKSVIELIDMGNEMRLQEEVVAMRPMKKRKYG